MLNDLYQNIDPVALAVGPLSVRWYGIAYVLGFICAAFVIYRTGKRWGLKFDMDSLCIIMICAMLGVLIGGRLGYVLFYGTNYYFAHPVEIFNFSNGGMSFHGGFIGALLAGIVAARMVSMSYLTLLDIAVIGVPLGLFFGRCANFINGELWGGPTDLPWAVVFGGAAGLEPRHPSQLYEALLEGVLLFAILFALSRKVPPRPQGTFFGVFMLGYGICRFLIEFVREPDVQLGYLWGGWLTMGQILSIPLIIAGVVVLIYAFKTKKPQRGPKLSSSQ